MRYAAIALSALLLGGCSSASIGLGLGFGNVSWFSPQVIVPFDRRGERVDRPDAGVEVHVSNGGCPGDRRAGELQPPPGC